MQRKLFAKLSDDEGVLAASAAIATGKLAQIASGFIYDEGTTNPIHTAKREWLEDLIEDTIAPTILVYEFQEDLRLLRELLGKDLPYLGGGVSDKQADSSIERWNKRELKFLAIHPASAGHGLNMQAGGADMAWISPTWSAENYEQTIARLYRSGQTRPVMVRICVASDTVDEMKLNRVHHKMSEQQAFEQYLRDHHAERSAA
jgi:SNF2 family DNA or RNA helicase